MQELLLLKREKANISKKQMADLLGITPKQYTKKEKGLSYFTSDEMFKILVYNYS